MDAVARPFLHAGDNRSISDTFARQRVRLRNFIRKRVPDPADAEDILQDVFHELIEATRLPTPIEEVGAWLFRVARNRIVDRFRQRRAMPFESTDDADLLPAADGDPESGYARRALLEALAAALDELPDAQRSVFIAHELEGRSFNELAAQSGVALNTLLARKRYAVLHLRARLRALYDDLFLP